MSPETIDSFVSDSLKPLVQRLLEHSEQNARLLARIDELLEQNKSLLARIAELEARGGKPPKSPTNSSKPPSAAPKANTAPPSPVKKGRKGRPGVARALCPSPDVVNNIYAEQCSCGTALTASDQSLAHAYDHIDLPVIKPVTTRINLHKAICPCCKKRVAAKPPASMAPGSPFGPGIAATVAYLHGCQMVSYNRLVEAMDGLFELKLSEGAIANMLARTAASCSPEAEKIAAIVRASSVIASDETSARVSGKTCWQWVFAAATAVYHTIQPSRGKRVPVEFLAGATPDVWMSDRLAAQATHAAQHQVCLAHLIRDAQYAIDAGDTVFAPLFKAFLLHVCGIGRRRSDLSDADLARAARQNIRRLDRLLELKANQTEGRHLRDAIEVRARDKLLVFLTRRDVDPTNNVSERALRPSVIFRKVTNGFRSSWGATAHADLRSIVATGQIKGRSALASLRAALASAPSAAAA